MKAILLLGLMQLSFCAWAANTAAGYLTSQFSVATDAVLFAVTPSKASNTTYSNLTANVTSSGAFSLGNTSLPRANRNPGDMTKASGAISPGGSGWTNRGKFDGQSRIYNPAYSSSMLSVKVACGKYWNCSNNYRGGIKYYFTTTGTACADPATSFASYTSTFPNFVNTEDGTALTFLPGKSSQRVCFATMIWDNPNSTELVERRNFTCCDISSGGSCSGEPSGGCV